MAYYREKLSAPDLIVISKVVDYIQNKLEGKNAVELLCMDQVTAKGREANTRVISF